MRNRERRREWGEPGSMVVSDEAVKHIQTPGKVPEKGCHGNQPEQGAGTCRSKKSLQQWRHVGRAILVWKSRRCKVIVSKSHEELMDEKFMMEVREVERRGGEGEERGEPKERGVK